MVRIPGLIILLLLTFTVAVAQTSNDRVATDSNSSIEQELKGLVREMHDTLIRCDKEQLFSFFADEFIGTSYEGYTTTKEQLVKSFRCPPAEAKITREIEDYKIRTAGNTFIVSYKVTERAEMGGKKSGGEYLYTDTFIKKDNLWKIISSHATRVFPERKVAKVDSEIYDDYAGRYASDPTTVFVITRDGDKLLGQAPNGEKVELLPENETTFFLGDRNIQVVFERGKSGQVIRMIIKREGGDLRLERVD